MLAIVNPSLLYQAKPNHTESRLGVDVGRQQGEDCHRQLLYSLPQHRNHTRGLTTPVPFPTIFPQNLPKPPFIDPESKKEFQATKHQETSFPALLLLDQRKPRSLAKHVYTQQEPITVPIR